MEDLAVTLVVWGAFLRGVAVVGAMLRTALNWKRFVHFQRGWVELVNAFEPFLLLAWSFPLRSRLLSTPPDPVAAPCGALLVLCGWALIVWTWLSWPAIYAGHGVLEGHRLVTRGAYARVRHPAYLAALLIWAGLALGTWSAATLLITVCYVVPSYSLYARSEEAMLLDAFGDAYADYRARVPMWIPRIASRVSRQPPGRS